MSSVTLKEVQKQYGKVNAVRGISMEIENGEFIAFLGPSGCGKSSTMRMIAGLEEVNQGDILLDGASVVPMRPGERNVAMAFETYALYPTLTVYENLAFPLRAARLPRDEVDHRVREVAGIIGVDELFDRKPGKLSSGQSQAVGLARALVRKPNVFLLDEPISHLDTSQRFRMRMYIKRLHIELGYTMILVTHDQEDALSLADRVAVMNEGKLCQIDTPQRIYEDPADLFVAGFIGDLPMNLVKGRMRREAGRTYVHFEGFELELPSGMAFRELPSEIVLGIRPSHLEVRDPGQGRIPGEIFVVEPLGEQNAVTVQAGGVRLLAVAPDGYRPEPCTPVSVSMDLRHIRLFDARTGKSIREENRP